MERTNCYEALRHELQEVGQRERKDEEEAEGRVEGGLRKG
jgi:hypothetical protein